MGYEIVHDPEEIRRRQEKLQLEQQQQAERAAQQRLQQLEMEETMAALETPAKEKVPPLSGSPDNWPSAALPDGEDICGNGHVLKQRTAPGISGLGKPPASARVKVAYTACTLKGREWDGNKCLGFRLGALYVNRVLEAAAANMEWGERASFVCTYAYAEENNATRKALPKSEACVRYEVELLSWRAPQLRDSTGLYEMSAERRLEAVVDLKAEAAALVRHGLHEAAREIYSDAIWYLENPDGRDDGSAFTAPIGREAESSALLVSLYLNDAMCTLKVADDYRRVEHLCTKALELDGESVKARYRRGVARTRLHEHQEAQRDLFAAAKLDPKSREVRDAIAELKEAASVAKQRDAHFAGKGFGNRDGPIARAPPGGGIKAPATVWLDVALGAETLGRLTIKLFEHAPLTTENFRCLCTGERGVGQSGVPLHYKGCAIHRIIPGFIVQGGDIVRGDGMGGDSIFGGKFRDERFLWKHDKRGLISMANNGPDTNSSQFFITLSAAPHLDGKSVVFGEVVDGLAVLERLEQLAVDANDRPTTAVTIQDCGEVRGGLTANDDAPPVAEVTGGGPSTRPDDLPSFLGALGLGRLQSTFDEEELTLPLLLAMASTELRANLVELGLAARDVDVLGEALLELGKARACGLE